MSLKSLSGNSLGVLVGLAAVLGVMLIFMAVAATIVVVRGLVLSYLWTWFMVPVFSLPDLTILQAYGLICLAGFIHPPALDHKKEEGEKSTSAIFWRFAMQAYLVPVLALTLGYIIHCMM